MLLVAQISGMAIVQWIILIIIVAAAFAIMCVALGKFGVPVPDWVNSIFWIVLVAVVAILAIKFLTGII